MLASRRWRDWKSSDKTDPCAGDELTKPSSVSSVSSDSADRDNFFRNRENAATRPNRVAGAIRALGEFKLCPLFARVHQRGTPAYQLL